MVNSVDWLYTRICVDGEELEISKADISEFVRAKRSINPFIYMELIKWKKVKNFF